MPSADISSIASCTTCSFDEDFSNYWTANLYFKSSNGSYKRVPQIANQGLNGDNGGITVYYTSSGAKQSTAFKPVCFSPDLNLWKKVKAVFSIQPLSCFELTLVWLGVPNACRRRSPTSGKRPWKEYAELLPLLHRAEFWRQRGFSLLRL